MAFGFKKFFSGINVVPKIPGDPGVVSANSLGDLEVSSTSNRIQFHNGSTVSPIVTLTSTDQGVSRLKNKDLEDSSTAIVDAADVTKKIIFNAAGTTGTSTTITGSQTANRVITIPDITDTLVAKTTTDTLTNKTLLDTSTIFANAADATKHVILDISGATTGKTLTIATPVTNNRTITLPDATDTLVGKATTDVLTNKTLSGNTSSNFINGSGTININSTGTITVPNATDTLVGKATSDTLTNKLLDTNSTLFVDHSDTTKRLGFDPGNIPTATNITFRINPGSGGNLVDTYIFPNQASGGQATVTLNAATQTLTNKTLSGNTATNLISGSGTLTLNTSGTITAPNATDTLVGKATTDILTNKTIDTASNTIKSTGAGAATVLTADGSNNTSWQSLSAILAAAPSQNYLANSGFDYAQKMAGNTATVANGASTYFIDRWYARNALGTNGLLTPARISGTTDGSLYAAQVKITQAPTAAQANGCELWQVIENALTLSLYNKTVVSQVKIKALGNVTQIGVQYFYDTGENKPSTSNNIGAEQTFTVNSSTFTTCTLASQALGTSMTTAGVVAIRIRITGVSSGNLYALNNGFNAEQAALWIGTVAPSTWQRMGINPAEELAYCKRFYNKTLPLNTAVGAVNSSPGLYYRTLNSTGGGGTTFTWSYSDMRAVPTATIYSPGTGASGNIRNTTASTDLPSVIKVTGINSVTGSNSSAATLNAEYNADFVVDAEI